MKGKNLWLCAVIFILSVAALSACNSKVTAESIMEQVKANTEDLDSLEARLLLEMEMGVSESSEGVNINMDMEVDVDVKMELINDPIASHILINVGISAAGVNMDTEMEVYLVAEDGETVVYGYEEGVWKRSVLEDAMDFDTLEQFTYDPELEFELEEKTEQVNGTKAYVLSTTVTGKDFDSILKEYMSTIDDLPVEDLGGLNFKDISVEIKYYVDKEKMLPLKMTMDLGDSIEKIVGGMEGAENFEFKRAYLELEFIDFNSVDAIEVPKKVRRKAVEVKETEETYSTYERNEIIPDEEGRYVLYNWEKTKTMIVSPPEGFEYSYSEGDFGYVSFSAGDIDVGYSIYDYATHDLLAEKLEYSYQWRIDDSDQTYQNVTLSDVQKVTVDAKEGYYRKLTYDYVSGDYSRSCIEYTVWIIEGDVAYVAEIDIFGSEDTSIDDSIVTKVFSAISFDTTI